jgi:amidase
MALLSAHETIMNWEVPRALAFERLAGSHPLQPTTRDGIAPLRGLTAEHYDAACAAAADAMKHWAHALQNFDALLTLPARGEAPEGLASTGDPIFNRAWTQLRLPCITVPNGTGRSGLPLGLQLVGAPRADGKLLAAASMAEAVLS